MEIFKLFGSIFVDNDAANKKIDETGERAAKTGNTLANSIKVAAKWGAGIAAAAAAAGGALFAFAAKTAQASGDLIDAAGRAGTTTTVLQEMRYALTQVGVAESDVSMALQRLNQRVGEADSGTGKYADALKRLGVSTRDVNGDIKTSDETFMELITRLHGVEDAQTQAALAGEIFGVNLAQRMLPAIQAGGRELANLRNRAHELGIVMEEDGLEAGAKFADMVDELRMVAGSLAQRIMLQVMPTLQKWLEWTAEQLPKIGAVFQFVGEVVGIVIKYMGLIIGDSVKWMREHVIDPFVSWLTDVWQERGPPIIEAAEKLWDGVKAVFVQVWDNIVALWEVFSLAFQGDWEGAWERLKKLFTDAWNALPDLFTGIINPLIDIADNVMTAVIDAIRAIFGDDVADIFQSTWDAAKTVFEASRDILLGIWTALTAAFKGDWQGAWDAMQGVLDTAWDTIETVVETGLDIVRTVIDGALNGIVALVRWAFGDEAADAVDEGFEIVRSTVQSVTDVIMGIIRTFSALFKGDWEAAWEEAKTTAQAAWDAVANLIDVALASINSLVNLALDGIVGLVRRVFGDDAADAVDDAFEVIRTIIDTATEAIMGVVRMFTALFAGDWRGAWDEAKGVVATVWDGIASVVETTLGLVGTIIDATLDGIVALFRWAFGDETADVVDGLFDAVRAIVNTGTDAIRGIVRAFSALFRGDWSEAWEEIKGVAVGIWNALPEIFEKSLDGIVGIADTIMQAVIGAIRNLFGDEIADSMSGIWDTILDVLDVFKDTFLGVWRALTAAFSGDWEGAWAEVAGVVSRVWEAIPGVVEGALNGLFGIIDTVMQSIIGLIGRVFGERVADVFQRGWDTVTIVFETARDTLLGILDVLSSLFVADWEAAWEGILSVLTRIWDGVLGIIHGPLDGVVEWVQGWALRLYQVFAAAKTVVVQAVRMMAEGIMHWLSESLLGKTFAWIGDQIGKVTHWFWDMYDKVVGRSYVPDMVEEIGEAIARLQDRLANPVARYTSEVIASFADMEDEVVASMMSMAERMDEVLDYIGNRISKLISDVSRDFWNGTHEWTDILHTFAGAIGDVFGNVFDSIAKEMVKNLIAQNTWLVSTLSTIATAISGYISMAYAALTSFFWFLGPAAPVAAAGVIAGVVAAVAKYAGQAFRNLFGRGAPDTPPDDKNPWDRKPSGGRQVSEITGPTRDLLTDLLTPLTSLNTLTGIGERIYGLLDERLPMQGMAFASAGIGGVNVTIAPGAVQVSGSGGAVDIEELSERLARKIAFELRGQGA